MTLRFSNNAWIFSNIPKLSSNKISITHNLPKIINFLHIFFISFIK